jgi:hypothetical protein
MTAAKLRVGWCLGVLAIASFVAAGPADAQRGSTTTAATRTGSRRPT